MVSKEGTPGAGGTETSRPVSPSKGEAKVAACILFDAYCGIQCVVLVTFFLVTPAKLLREWEAPFDIGVSFLSFSLASSILLKMAVILPQLIYRALLQPVTKEMDDEIWEACLYPGGWRYVWNS